jgi:diguanylate cyclase (GGDEF)-like protein/PAS domain S-box-containing protein
MTQDSLALPLINACDVGVITLDESQLITVWNDRVAKASGFPAALAYGRRLHELFDRPVAKALQRAIDQCLRSGTSTLLSHSIHRAPLPFYLGASQRERDERIDHSVTVKPLRVRNGARFCLIQVSDLSESISRERKLRQQAAELSELARRNERGERYMRAVMNHMVDGLICFNDLGQINSFNTAAERMFGWGESGHYAKDIGELLAREHLQLQIDASHSRKDWESRYESTGFRNDGQGFPVEVSISCLDYNVETLYIALVRDLTSQRAMEELAHRGRELAEVALESIRDGVITTDGDGRITYLNLVAAELTGLQLASCEGEPLLSVFDFEAPEVAAGAQHLLDECLADRYVGSLTEDGVVNGNDGSTLVLDNHIAPLRSKSGSIIGSVMVFRDHTVQHSMVQRLSYHATHDELTGLLNRREFNRRLEEAIHSAREEDRSHAVCYIDLDQFKVVNDTSGHAAGDELLRRIADLLRAKVRRDDVLARLGGDEFGLLLNDYRFASSRRVIQKLREEVEDFRFLWEGKTFSIGMSVGMVEIKGGEQTKETVMSAADTACYAAKEHGRNRVWEYTLDDDELERRQGEMRWVTRINEALEEQRLRLFCQSITPLRSCPEREGHYEVLLRMVDRDGELVPPMAFIPAAERYDLMNSLDRWVVEACLKHLANNPALTSMLKMISINISGQSLGDERFLSYVENQLTKYGVPEDLICFEITETAAIARLTAANEFINRLRARGCKFALDDFGNGLSSFAYLKTLQVDYLKIDGLFVKDMVTDPIDAAMVESINRIGRVIGIKTIAEFAENDAIMEMLRGIGVDYAQGWGISKPEPIESLVERFTDQRKTA